MMITTQQTSYKMQKYYFVIVTTTADRLWYDKEGLHRLFKVWFRKKTTSWMSYDEWYEYLENVLDLIAHIWGRRYDSERRHNDQVPYYDLPYCQIDYLF